MYTDHNLPRKFPNQKKWDHLRTTLTWFDNHAERKLKAPRKTVLEKRGFLVYYTLTYYFLTDYMKGIHTSVEAYCTNNTNKGWERELIQQEPNPIDIFDFG